MVDLLFVVAATIDLSGYAYQRPIDTSFLNEAQNAWVELDQHVLDHSNISDIRIIDSEKSAQPYRINIKNNTASGSDSGVEYDVNAKVLFRADPMEDYLLLYGNPTMESQPNQSLIADINKPILSLGDVQVPAEFSNDIDSDGIENSADNCPKVSNVKQFDSDSDGLGDECDDDDFDGIANHADNCRYDANKRQVDTDRDGIGDDCDQTDDRFGEKNPEFLWIIFAFSVIMILLLVIRLLKTNPGKDGSS